MRVSEPESDAGDGRNMGDFVSLFLTGRKRFSLSLSRSLCVSPGCALFFLLRSLHPPSLSVRFKTFHYFHSRFLPCILHCKHLSYTRHLYACSMLSNVSLSLTPACLSFCSCYLIRECACFERFASLKSSLPYHSFSACINLMTYTFYASLLPPPLSNQCRCRWTKRGEVAIGGSNPGDQWRGRFQSATGSSHRVGEVSPPLSPFLPSRPFCYKDLFSAGHTMNLFSFPLPHTSSSLLREYRALLQSPSPIHCCCYGNILKHVSSEHPLSCDYFYVRVSDPSQRSSRVAVRLSFMYMSFTCSDHACRMTFLSLR